MEPQNLSDLELNYLAPTVGADGNVVFITSDGDIPTITFFQVRKQQGNKVYADAVASVKMNSLEDLKRLQTAISDTILKHESREK